jgi:COP9 signalosome complex subunit 7
LFLLGLIEGKIDQQSQKVFVDFAIGRDVRDGDLLRVQEVLATWVARSGTLVKLMDEKIALARSEIKVAQIERDEFDKRVKEVKDNLRAIMEAQEADQRMQGKRRKV